MSDNKILDDNKALDDLDRALVEVVDETTGQLYSFGDILKILLGNPNLRATRVDWKDQSTYIELNGGHLQIMRNNTLYDLIVTDGDIAGEDWVLI